MSCTERQRKTGSGVSMRSSKRFRYLGAVKGGKDYDDGSDDGVYVSVCGSRCFRALKFIQNSVGSMDGKAKRTPLEKPKRHRLALSDDGELVELNDNDEPSLLYEGEERW